MKLIVFFSFSFSFSLSLSLSVSLSFSESENNKIKAIEARQMKKIYFTISKNRKKNAAKMFSN